MRSFTFTRVVKVVSFELYTVTVKAASEAEARAQVLAGDWTSEKHVGEAAEANYLASGLAVGTGPKAEEDAYLRCTEQMDPLGVDDGDDD